MYSINEFSSDSIMASISPCPGDDRGSIPCLSDFFLLQTFLRQWGFIIRAFYSKGVWKWCERTREGFFGGGSAAGAPASPRTVN